MVLTKKELNAIAKNIGVKNPSKMKKEDLIALINKDTHHIVLKEPGVPVKHVYHSADLHIRPLERHDEYRSVFKNFIEILKQKAATNPGFKDENVFVLCGDIFHARDKLLSETILLFNELVIMMTEVIPVIFILGNHDTFTHANRLDTVSGITDIKGFPDFFFLKESGIYRYSNLVFGLSSILDNVFVKSEQIPDAPGLVKIGLFHGQVKGAKINELYSVPDSPEMLTVNDFKGYGLVLLGDIHKRQFVTPTIAYPGSFIQQNHGEEREKGLLLWDVETKQCDFIPIYNDYSFVSITSQDYLSQYYTKFSRIRLFITQEELNDTALETRILQHLENHTVVISFTKEIYRVPKSVKNKVDVAEETIPSKEKIIKNYFYDYLDTQSLPEELMEKIKQKHVEMTRELFSHTDEKEFLDWRIVKLSFKNVFSYGKDILNTVTFDKNKVIGILGTNAIGKTSIMNTLVYALFGNNYKGSNTSSRNILNKNASQFFIEMEIERGKDIVKIQKFGKNKARKGALKGINEDVKLFVNDEEITDTNKSVTTEKWYELLGIHDKETFLLTNLLSYTSINCSLLSMTSTEIGNTFNRLFDTSYLRDIYTLVLKEYKQTNSELDVYRKTLQNLHIKDTILLQQSLEKVLVDTARYQEEKEEISEKLKGIAPYKQDNYSEKMIQEAEDFLKKHSDIACLHMRYFSQRKRPSKNTHVYTIESIQKFEKKLESIGVDSTNPVERLYEMISRLSKEVRYLDKEHTKKTSYKEKFDVDMLIEDLEKTKHQVLPKDLVEDLVEYLKDTVTPDYVTFSYNTLMASEIQKVKIHNETVKAKIANIEEYIHDYDQIQAYISHIFYKMDHYKEYLYNYQLYLQNKDKTALQTQMNIIEKELSLLFKKQGSLENELVQNEKIQEKRSDITLKIQELTLKNEVVYHYKEIIKVLPKLIISSIITKIQEETNMVLYKFTGLHVNLNTVEDEDSKWEITFSKDNLHHIGADNLSGYEKFISNIAMKIALDRFKFQGRAKIFCVDEVFDSISEENIERIPCIFETLKENYSSVLMISHNTTLKHMIDSLIKIENTSGNSRVTL
jgi:DNA repair exonuclease SbcCD ATPase subunit/DNA repair exonuclease SbcCD nuclease subunit